MQAAEKQNQKHSEELRNKNTQIESLKREVQRLEAESREWQELCTNVAKRNRLDKVQQFQIVAIWRLPMTIVDCLQVRYLDKQSSASLN